MIRAARSSARAGLEHRRPGLALAILVLSACAHPRRAADAPAAPAAPRPPQLLLDRASPFGRVLVLDEGPLRVMRFGSARGSEQSAIVRGHPEAVPIEYVRTALLGLAHHGRATSLLMIGLGGGTFTTLVHRALPEVTIDVVEIDPVVATAARDLFDLREDARYRVHVADAIDWIAAPGAPYDYVFLDTYAGEEIPPPLRASSFFAAVRRRLAPGGIVAVNLAELHAEGREAARAFRATFAVFDCRQAPTDGNLILFGAAAPRAIDPPALLRWADAWDARHLTNFSLRTLCTAPRGSDCDRVLTSP